MVLGLLFWSSSGIGVLLLSVEVAPSGRVRGVWVRDGWGLGGVLGRSGRVVRGGSLGVIHLGH